MATTTVTTVAVLCLSSALLFATLEPALAFSGAKSCFSTQEHHCQNRIGDQVGSITSSTSRKQQRGALFAASAADNADKTKTIPSDPAKTTPQFLTGLWKLIARGNHMVKGVRILLLFLLLFLRGWSSIQFPIGVEYLYYVSNTRASVHLFALCSSWMTQFFGLYSTLELPSYLNFLSNSPRNEWPLQKITEQSIGNYGVYYTIQYNTIYFQ